MPSLLPTLTSEQWTELNSEFSSFVYELRQKKAFFTLIHAINEFKEAMVAYSLDLSEYDYFFDRYRVSTKQSQDLSDTEMISRIQLILGKYGIPYEKSHLESPSSVIKRPNSQKDEQWTLDGEPVVKRTKSKKVESIRKNKKEELPKTPPATIQKDSQLNESIETKKKQISVKSSPITDMRRSTATLSLIKTNPVPKSATESKIPDKISPIEPDDSEISTSPTPLPSKPKGDEIDTPSPPVAPKVSMVERKVQTLTELPKKPILPPSYPQEMDDVKKLSHRFEKKASKSEKRPFYNPVPIPISELSSNIPDEIVLNTPQVPKKSDKSSTKSDDSILLSPSPDVLRKPTLPPKLEILKKSKPYDIEDLSEKKSSTIEANFGQNTPVKNLEKSISSKLEIPTSSDTDISSSPFPNEKRPRIPEKDLYASVGDADLLGVLKDFDQRKEKSSTDSKNAKKTMKLKDFELEQEKKKN